LAALLLTACGSTAPSGPSRSYRMGFSPLPPRNRAKGMQIVVVLDPTDGLDRTARRSWWPRTRACRSRRCSSSTG